MERRAHSNGLSLTLAAGLLLVAGTARADWPNPPERSGASLPGPRDLSVAAFASGVYVPEVSGLASGDTGVLEGSLTWSFAPWRSFGLFGRHTIAGMWWGNLTILTLGSEAGARWLATRRLAVEAAYLGHRAEHQWVERDDGSQMSVALGGIRDHGGELGTWLRLEPFSRLRLEGHLLGRVFRVYDDTQGALGVGLRASVMPADGQAVVLEVTLIDAIRERPRHGVDHSTLNVLGAVSYRIDLTHRVGLELGARMSTNMLCGEVPMLELKRSMISEPMLMGQAGVYFRI
ncbi:MAG: hypothetical protein PHU25_02095 [Deltaproteobacteria bacterium]|nr:hypothetical protein [Deltaproteobacteria bacterium]